MGYWCVTVSEQHPTDSFESQDWRKSWTGITHRKLVWQKKSVKVGKSRVKSAKIIKIPASPRLMDVHEILTLADELVFTQTGKHLDNLQQDILRGACKGKKYSKIAEEFHCSEGHVKDVASELWKVLSQALGQEVNKFNFRATVERLNFSKNFLFNKVNKDLIYISKFSVCGDTVHYGEEKERPEKKGRERKSKSDKADRPLTHPSKKGDHAANSEEDKKSGLWETKTRFLEETRFWRFASFYGRTEEQNTLEQWIVKESTRLVALVGLSGIGKTTLAVQCVTQIQDKFDYIIWQSLRSSPPLKELLTNLLKSLSNQSESESPADTEDQLSLLMQSLQEYRCLLILDDGQMILSRGQLAGHYQPGYEEYGEFFRCLGEFYHHSCLLLLGWEPPAEIGQLEGENAPVRCYQLKGLSASSAGEFFREKELGDEETWPDLIHQYRGHPFWLKMVATTIADLFSGGVSEFLKYEALFLDDAFKQKLKQQIDRLSKVEKKVMLYLVTAEDSVTTSALVQELELSLSEILNAIKSLSRRSLIEKITQDQETVFTVQPVIQQYLTSQYSGNLA